MNNTSDSFQNMIAEIKNYEGDFGDSIIWTILEIQPLSLLENGDKKNEIGAGLALLVNFVSEADNSTYSEALTGQSSKNIKTAISKQYCHQYPTLVEAFDSVFESEFKLLKSLNKITLNLY